MAQSANKKVFFQNIFSQTEKNNIQILHAVAFASIFTCTAYVNTDIQNGITIGKHFYFVVCSSLVILITSVLFLLSKRVSNRIRLSIIDTFVLGHLLYVFVILAFSQYDFIKEPRFIELVLLSAVYFIAKSLFLGQNDSCQIIIMGVFLSLGLYEASLGILQLYDIKTGYHSVYKITGSFFNPAPYGGYLASIFPAGLAVYHLTPPSDKKKRFLKYLGLITALMTLFIISSTLSRASWISLITGTIVLYSKYFGLLRAIGSYLRNRILKLITFASILAIVAIVASCLYHWKNNSVLGRILMWEVSLEMLSENPLLGVGFDKFTAEFGRYQSIHFQKDLDQTEAMVAGKGEFAFNEFLLVGTEEGLIGLILFLGMIVPAIRLIIIDSDLKENHNSFYMAAKSGFVSLLTFSAFSYPFSITPLHLNFFFFLAIISASKHTGMPCEINALKTPFFRLIVFLLTICLLSWILKTEKRTYNALDKWEAASRLKSIGFYKEAIEDMKKIEPILENNGDFMFQYGQALTMNKEYEKAIEVLNKASLLTSDPYLFNSLGNCYQALNDYEAAEQAYFHAFYLIPHKFYPRYLLAKLYQEMGEKEKAVNMAKLLLKMPVKIHSTAIEEMKAEMLELVASNGK